MTPSENKKRKLAELALRARVERVEFEEELEQYPQTLSEYYADIGMSERDF